MDEKKSLGGYFREVLRYPMVIFGLVVAVIVAVGAPLFAIANPN